MKFKKKGFTLIELLTVFSIGAILITISTNWYIKNVVDVNNNNNRNIDLQSGVSTSMDMIKNTLRKATQVYLVDKNVYDPNTPIADLTERGLDKNYNYIALYKDPTTQEIILAHIVYVEDKVTPSNSKFTVIPIIASDRKDSLKQNVIAYSMKFYKNDHNYKEKLENNIINVTIQGVSKDIDKTGTITAPENNKDFELSEDIYLPNTNQILISKFLEGGIQNVTAIAYHNSIIEQAKPKNKSDMSFIFTFDMSDSMETKDMPLPDGTLKSRLEVARKNILKFLEDINKLGISNNITVEAYLCGFYIRPDYHIKQLEKDVRKTENIKHIYELSTILSKTSTTYPGYDSNLLGYGPYKLGRGSSQLDLAKKFINTRFSDIKQMGGTNTGEAILQACEILNQLRATRSSEKQFFILLTDGQPLGYTYYEGTGYDGRGTTQKKKVLKWNSDTNRTEWVLAKVPKDEYMLDSVEKYKNFKDFLVDKKRELKADNDAGLEFSMEYIKSVTDPFNDFNLDNTFDKAYLVGFSPNESDKIRLGIPKPGVPDSPDSIRSYLSRTKSDPSGKKEDVFALDASNDVSLASAFDQIINNISINIGVFDGPKKLTK